jgi:IclR family KDG regulon transcriptional repressor
MAALAPVRKREPESKTGHARDVGTTSLLRALCILEMVAQKSGGFTNAEISRRLKIATSTTSYILSRLEREGYLTRDAEDGRYEIGLKVVALAHGALRGMGLRKVAEPILHRLVAETRYSGIVGVLERGLMMIVDKVERPDLAFIDMDIGVRYPAHSTALGKVLLAHLPPLKVAKRIERYAVTPASRNPKFTVEGFMRELATVKKQGYAMSDGELYLGISAIAAPILDSNSVVRAAVSATGPTRMAEEDKLIACVTRAARDISQRLKQVTTLSR